MQNIIFLLVIPLASCIPFTNNFPFRFGSSGFGRTGSFTSGFSQFRPIALGRSNLVTSGDIVAETRSQAESLKSTIKNLASQPGPARIINRILKDPNNVCIDSVDQAIEDIDEAVRIIDEAGPDVKSLIRQVESFVQLTDVPTVVRDSANILRQLEVVVPKLSPSPRFICAASQDETFGSLYNLAYLLDELSNTTEFQMSEETRVELRTSSKALSGVTFFVKRLGSSFSKFNQLCTSDKEYNVEAIKAIGQMMDDLADLFSVLGGYEDAKEIRKQGEFINRVVVRRNIYHIRKQLTISFQTQVRKLGDLGLGSLECDNHGSFKVAANTMDDIANLVEEVGVEALCNQLDLDDCFF